MPKVFMRVGKWLGYLLLAALALVALKENDSSRKAKEQSIQYSQCINQNKGTPVECEKMAHRK